MKIAVCIKQTPDTTTRIELEQDQRAIKDEGIQWIISPYDEFAIEEALQLAASKGGEVTVVSMGPPRVEKSIREALAMGAHKAIRIDCVQVPDDPGVTAKVLAEVLGPRSFDLIFTGRQAVDDDHAQVPARLAHVLGWACVNVVIKLDLHEDHGVAVREVESGSEHVRFTLPAVIGANRHLNEPRYRSMRGIMMAKRIPIEVVQVDLPAPKIEVLRYAHPPQKGERRLFTSGSADVPEVVRLLLEEAQVL